MRYFIKREDEINGSEKKSNILAEEEPKYIISLKEGYRILHIIMSILFLSCTLYFGMISFRAGTDTMVFDIGFTGIVFVFFIYTLNGMTKRCERYKEKVVYSCLFTKENIICQTLHPPMKKLKNSIRIMAMAM